MFSSLPILGNLRAETLQALMENFTGTIYYTGEEIVNCYSGATKLSIVKEGAIDFCYFKSNSSFNGTVISKHEASAEKQLMLNLNTLFFMNPINYDINAAEYCFIYEIESDLFLTTLRESSLDFEFYFMMKDKLSVN